MKKDYKKPMIYFESFALSQTIAAGCSLISEGEDQPAYDPETGWEIYVTGLCSDTPPNPTDEICYHVPTAGWNVFTS